MFQKVYAMFIANAYKRVAYFIHMHGHIDRELVGEIQMHNIAQCVGDYSLEMFLLLAYGVGYLTHA